jgi:tetratricopeptide (TPR) repeat protein
MVRSWSAAGSEVKSQEIRNVMIARRAGKFSRKVSATLLGLLLAGVVSSGEVVREAAAQGGEEWSVQGGKARDQEILRRYKMILERSPTEGLAFKKILEMSGKGAGLDRLIAEYQDKAKREPKNANFWLIVGHLLKAKGDGEGAMAAYGEAIALKPNDPLGYLGRGEAALLVQGKQEEAQADFEACLKLEKDRARKQDILRKLADIAFDRRDWDKAQEYFDRLVELDPRNEYLRFEYAQVLIKYKRYDKAVEQYQALLKLAGGNVKTRVTTMRDLGELYEQMGKDDEALEQYRQGLKLVTSSNWLYRELQQRIIGVYRRTDRLQEFLDKEAANWRSLSYDQAMMLAGVYEELGKEEEALKHYKLAGARDGRNVDPRLKVIQIHQRRGNTKEVMEGYQALIRIAPGESRYQFDLARLYFRDGDRKRGEAVLQQIRRRFARDPDVLVQLADVYMRFEMQDEALEIYKQLVRNEPRNESFLTSLGEYYYQSGQIERAIETWMKILKSDLPRGEAYARLGEVMIDHEMMDRGISYIEQARQIAPEDKVIMRALALAYERDRRWDQAVEVWQEIMRVERQQPTAVAEARGRIITIYQRQDKLRTRMREFEALFEAKPPDAEAGFLLAEAHVKLGEPAKAEAIYRKLVELDGALTEADVPALVALERVSAVQGKTNEAIAALQQLAKLRPQSAKEYYHRIAELSLRSYDDEQAVEYARLALKQNPDDAVAHGRLGDVWVKMQRYEEAISAYREALDLDPRAFQYAMALADLLAGQGKRREALKLYEEVIERSSDEGQVLTAGRKGLALSRDEQDLEALENAIAPLVFRSPPRPVYRKLALELYTRMLAPLVLSRRFGARLDAARRRSLDAIAQRSYPVLMDAVQSDDMALRQAALRMFGELGLGNAAAPLALLVEDKREPMRLEAAIAVARIGDARASRSLLRALEDENPAVRDVATWALGAMGGLDAVARLGRVLNEGANTGQQVLAAVSLGRIGGEQAGQLLLAALEQRRAMRWADATSAAIVWALGEAKEARATQLLMEVLAQSPGEAKSLAAWSLGRAGGQQAASALFKVYWGPDLGARAQAARALVQLVASARKEGGLYEEIDQEARFIQVRAQMFDTEGLMRRLREQAEFVPPVDASALVVRQRGQIVEVARAVLTGSDARAQAQVLIDLNDPDHALMLGGKGEPQAMQALLAELSEPLRALASSPNVQVRAGALGALGRLGQAQDLEALVSACSDAQPQVRQAALRALGAGFTSSPQAMSAAARALADSVDGVRAEAAHTLGRGKVSGQRAALEARLADEASVVRLEAVQALAEIGDAQSAPALIAAMGGSPREVRAAILRALGALGSAEARAELERWAAGEDLALRRVAREALGGR